MLDDCLHIVWLIWIIRDDIIEGFVGARRRIFGRDARWVIKIVGGNVAHQLANHTNAVRLTGAGEVRHAAGAVMNHGPTKLFKRDVLVRHRLEYVWPRHKHVASLLHHKNKVGDGGGVDRAARAGSHNGRNLWHDARCQRVAQENISVGSQADHALLDARPA